MWASVIIRVVLFFGIITSATVGIMDSVALRVVPLWSDLENVVTISNLVTGVTISASILNILSSATASGSCNEGDSEILEPESKLLIHSRKLLKRLALAAKGNRQTS